MMTIMLALTLAAAKPTPESVPIYGVANSSCTFWKKSKADPNARLLSLSFVNGYLTALSQKDYKDFPARMTGREALSRIDWYCDAQPSWTVADALAALLGELKQAAATKN